MRNKYNANFYEEDKKYNTNQNNTDESNLDNNHGNKHNLNPTKISEVEFGSEFNEYPKRPKNNLGKTYDHN